MMTTLAVLEEITKDLTTVSDADVRRAERSLGAARDGEKPLGTIHNEAAYRAWALANGYEAKGMEIALNAKYRANSEDEQTAMVHEALRFGTLQSIVRDMFWAQAKADIGGDAWCSKGGVGVRSGWMLVSLPQHPVESLLSKILGESI